ncbi:MAG: tRNA (5-methylaminomethyl-2-thiouridine)(34)-methyltransferase MnmD, partial [Leptonema sp. (in: Bacteria)]|nr:tRNA (5-methylaminomethyl-2-thiouridine)(34)-methyltransferase MnmD [Leptonema sp. (in: bacteria)]
MALRSDIYDDIYFSNQSGIEESMYTFIEANRLTDRFRTFKNGRPFTVGELGFGTGLNFLLTAKSFLENASEPSILHYFSVEKHPLPINLINDSLSDFEWLGDLRQRLMKLLRESSWRIQGFHTLFFDRRVRLTILTGDVFDRLQELSGGSFDAWFADGFAPTKNPDMWTLPVFQEVARLSKPGTTISSFSSAGEVRRNLHKAGFSIQKKAGYGNKREMITGQFNGKELKTEFEAALSTNQTAVIVGGGISGLSVAEALLKRGWQVQLNERHSKLASEASGNPTAMFLPYLTADKTAISDLTFRGSETFISALPAIKASHLLYRTGILQRTGITNQVDLTESISLVSGKQQNLEEKTKQRNNRISRAVIANGLPRSFFRKIADHHYFMRKAGWTQPAKLCDHLAHTLKEEYGEQFTINKLSSIDFDNLPTADAIILATGTELSKFKVASFIPIISVRGQFFECNSNRAIEFLNQSKNESYCKPKLSIKRPILYENYIIPKKT